MNQDTHFTQDACEYYAVAKMQQFSEDCGRAIEYGSKARRDEYNDYLNKRGLSHKIIENSDYVRSIDKAIPDFLRRLFSMHEDEKVNFINIEKEARDKNLKGDFKIEFLRRESIDFSLKNYKGGIRRIQLKSGTFNSFILNFLFKPSGVGTLKYTDEKGDEIRFRGSNKNDRDQAIKMLGYDALIPLVHKMDSIHEEMRHEIFESGNYEFYDEQKFDSLRKRIGLAGVATALQIIEKIDPQIVKKQIIDMTGFDGSEELLAVSPNEYLDSYTNRRFHKFRNDLLDGNISLEYQVRGQSLIFSFELHGKRILNVDIPFTINSNGAWFRDTPFEGEIFHPKEKIKLRYGQLRPKKSREIATSINTYVDLGSTYIYSEDEV